MRTEFNSGCERCGIPRRHRETIGTDLFGHAAYTSRHHRRAAQKRFGDDTWQTIGEAWEHEEVGLVIFFRQF